MSGRREGRLSSLVSSQIPRELLFFDTETFINPIDDKISELPFRLGAAIHVTLDNDLRAMKRKVFKLYSVDDFIETICYYERKKSKLYVFAHNIKFDIMVLNLVHRLHEEGFTSKPPIINGRQFIWIVQRDSYKVVFLDTANYGVMSVSQLGSIIAHDKGTVDFDNVDDDTLMSYCIRDVEILENFILEFIRFLVTNNLGSFRYTIASQALTAFRTSLHDRLPYLHKENKVFLLEESAYHGGRTEAFYIGQLPHDDYYYIDVNSMYPHVMVNSDLPDELMGYDLNPPVEYLPVRLKRFYVIADVTIETDKPFCCIVKGAKLIFPVGQFRTTLHHKELDYALRYASIKQVHRCAVYSRHNPFRNYVDFFYRLKQQSNTHETKLWRFIAKLFLNALYGKFGQKQPHREDTAREGFNGVFRETGFNHDTGKSFTELHWFGKVFEEYREGETSFSHRALAGAITANARMYLWQLIEDAGLDNVYYCDTDSLITNQTGYQALQHYLDDNELGKLKLEEQSRDVTIYGAKDYKFGDITRKKGVPPSAKEIAADKWEYLQFLGFISWLNNGAVDLPTTTLRTKSRISKYNKGIVSETGKVYPIRLYPDLGQLAAD